LNYSGCYISKTSYVRQGEPPFGRTREYKQWHVVEYYRYLRFVYILVSEGLIHAAILNLIIFDRNYDGLLKLNSKFKCLIVGVRFFRFFPEGKVLMMTTSEPPAAMIAHLRYRNPKYPAVIKGRFDLCGEQLTLILQRTDTKTVIKNNNREISEKAHNTYSIVRISIIKSKYPQWTLPLVWVIYRIIFIINTW